LISLLSNKNFPGGFKMPKITFIGAGSTVFAKNVYQAAMLDPHTAAELSLDDIVKMVDNLIAAHGNWLPEFK